MQATPIRRDVLRGAGAVGLGITALSLPAAAAASSIAVVANASAWTDLFTASGDAVTTATGAAAGITIRAFARDTATVSYPAVSEANHSSNGQGQGIACDDTYVYYGWSRTTPSTGFFIGRTRLDGAADEPEWVQLATTGADWYSISSLAVSAGHLYVTSRDGTSIIRVARDGTSQVIWQNWWASSLEPALNQRLTAIATTATDVYVTDTTGSSTLSAVRVFRVAHSSPTAGRNDAKPHFQVIASDLPARPTCLAVTTEHVYVGYGTGNDGWIGRFRLDGTFPVTQWARVTLDGTTALDVRRMAADATTLYVQTGSDATSRIVGVNLATGGVSTVVAATATVNGQPFRQGIALGPVTPA